MRNNILIKAEGRQVCEQRRKLQKDHRIRGYELHVRLEDSSTRLDHHIERFSVNRRRVGLVFERRVIEKHKTGDSLGLVEIVVIGPQF